MTPQAQGLWARLLVRALVVAAAGVMALGFLGAGAAVLVAALTVLTYVLLWLRSRFVGGAWPFLPGHGEDAGEAPDPTDFR
ncbi:hypothetical protein IDM40_03915 [Nocardiopsis sp. HNM0947]|uniref:Uncharacterized protein n=1 Tax=Nocardiopsis coralli TaxID=2772213 RepID=A0ABR9P270_9ACTN|nr:hypothetical protein [Nocardiopsis coralli]MBE2997860.1 hypothetical protein [Nocardiopsis coralli]